jgi:hypothetical protein
MRDPGRYCSSVSRGIQSSGSTWELEMRKDGFEYIHNLARTIAGQHGIRAEQWSDTKNWPACIPEELSKEFDANRNWRSPGLRRPLAYALRNRYWHLLSHAVSRFTPERQGLICACGPHVSRFAECTRLSEVTDEQISLEWAGSWIITYIATLVVIAAMTDNLLNEMIQKYEQANGNDRRL